MPKLILLTLTGALLLAGQVARAQSADVPRGGSVTGLKDPEPADPRYVTPSELARLKDQVHTLQEAYGQLKQEQLKQAERLTELEKAPPPQDAAPARVLPSSSMSLRKP